MCGIFGSIDFSAAPVERGFLKEAGKMLSRRGPDEEGLFIEESPSVCVSLLHRRLDIIDLETGRQPMSNEGNDIVLVCNGEIYNFRQLRQELTGLGHVFKSKSDSEVIIHAYEQYSFACLDHLRGMFAFALWDAKNRLLFIARDRAGKKPLYYYFDGNDKILFSSEIRVLLKYPGLDKSQDAESLLKYFSYCYIPAPDTAFKRIKKLETANYLVFSANGVEKQRYWDLDFSQKLKIKEEEAAERIAVLLRESVNLRMISDVPVGAFLSGGLDSSIITGLMSKETGYPVETFSVGFKEEGFNELPHAFVTQKEFSCKHHELLMGPDSVKRLPELLELFGEPHADSSALATMLLAEEAKKSITVTLVGEGADEVFGGYGRYYYFRLARGIAGITPFFNANLINRYKRWLGGLKNGMLKDILEPDFLKLNASAAEKDELGHIFMRAWGYRDIDPALYADSMFFLPNDLLVKLDVSTMAFGLEARAPFLDHKLMEFAAKLPANMKLNGKTSKYILRRAFSGLVPQEIINRQKTGFTVPVGEWFRGRLKDYLNDMLLSKRCLKRGYFRSDGLKRLVDGHMKGRKDSGHHLWAILVFELWNRIFIDEK